MLKNLKEFNLPEIEKKILAFWSSDDTFKKSINKTKVGESFVFFEGPPTANGRPGIHHVLTRAFKDIILRYKTMRGYHVERKAGWDTHGLPVEIEVEKELGINSKPEIEKYGIEAFNKKARQSVWKYKTEWEKLTERVGFWIDFDNPYITYETKYIESLWWVVKKIHEKGYLYKGHRIAPWCIRCGTALSSHEMAQGYKDTKDISVYIPFELIDEPETYVLAWTTTPWTLPGNVSLAINPEIQYVKIRVGGEKGLYILAKDLLGDALQDKPYEIVEKVDPKNLSGKKYKPLFDYYSNDDNLLHRENGWTIELDTTFVSAENGTGIVHMAPPFGDDIGMEHLEKYKIPFVQHVHPDGTIKDEVTDFKGLKVKDKDGNQEADVRVVKNLAERGLLFTKRNYTHSYPHCWRCSTPLLYYARESWFIAMSQLKDKLLAANDKINWMPEHIKKGRFGNWLEEVKDWNLSRERYWGTPLPVWQCGSCDHYVVIGSVDELRSNSSDSIPDNPDLHRPFIDTYHFNCDKCEGGTMERVKELIDGWFDSGAMPFAEWHYPFENKEKIDKGTAFPADYIVEGVDQTRGWFYTLLAISVLLGYENPYKNCLVLGHILDGKGLKMSKSKGNIIDPWTVADTHGADAIRWHFFTASDPGEPTRFDENDLKKASRRIFALLYNSYVFLSTYQGEDRKAISLLDRWIISRLQETTREVTKHLDAYNIFKAGRTLEVLVDDLSRWYIRRSRKNPSLATLVHVLKGISILFAPFTPFFADALYQSVHVGGNSAGAKAMAGRSVHLEDWLDVREDELDQEVLDNMKEVRRLASLALARRDEAGIRVRQPLQVLKVKSDILNGNEALMEILKDEVNVKEIMFDKSLKEEIELDTEINSELKTEGTIRELVRMIQGMRRDAKLNPNDEIILVINSVDNLLGGLIESHEDKVKKSVNAKKIVFHGSHKTAVSVEKKIDGQLLKIGLKKA